MRRGEAAAADVSDLTVAVSTDETGMVTVAPTGPAFVAAGSCSYVLSWPLGAELNGTHSQTLSTKVAPSEDGSCPTWTVRLPAALFPGGQVDAEVEANEQGGFCLTASGTAEAPTPTGALASNLPIPYFTTGELHTGVEVTWAPELVGSARPMDSCSFSHGEFAANNTLISGGLDYSSTPSCSPVTWTPAGTYIDAGQAVIAAGSGGIGLPGEDAGFDCTITIYRHVLPAPEPTETPTPEPTETPTLEPTATATTSVGDGGSCPAPTLTLEQSTVASSGELRLRGCGFPARETVALTMDGDPRALGQVLVGDDGTFSVTCAVPAGVSGNHTVTAATAAAPALATAPVLIVAGPSATPPPTSTDSQRSGSSFVFASALAMLAALAAFAGLVHHSRMRSGPTPHD